MNDMMGFGGADTTTSILVQAEGCTIAYPPVEQLPARLVVVLKLAQAQTEVCRVETVLAPSLVTTREDESHYLAS